MAKTYTKNIATKPETFLTQSDHSTSVAWNRLEGRPRSAEFEGALKAEVRDPLWTLCRQWQFGEFRADDAGSPVKAKVQIKGRKLDLFESGSGVVNVYTGEVPLEAKVEAEMISETLELSIRMGHMWLRLLKKKRVRSQTRRKYVKRFPISIPDDKNPENDRVFAHQEVWQGYAASAGRAMDGYAFYKHIKEGGSPLSRIRGLEDGEKTKIRQCAREFEEWFERAYVQPTEESATSWQPRNLEYRFAISVGDGTEDNQTLSADEYHQGHLDWYSLDIDNAGQSLERPGGSSPPSKELHTTSFVPVPIEFGGMPKTRWWEFEDSATNFGKIDAETTDLARLLLMEFGLLYANDWFLVPFELPVGHLYTVTGLAITDVFGQRRWIEAAGRGPDDDWQAWRMFNLNTRGDVTSADNSLFLPPTISVLQESKPIESVNFVRDEMANMVWAIETRIPLNTGGGKDGREAAIETRHYYERHAEPAESEHPPLENEAKIRYQLQTEVLENWIPFIPVRVPDSTDSRQIQLQRGATMRYIKGAEERIFPRTELLSVGINSKTDLSLNKAYFIHEEEVPRAGVIVNQTFQRARWYNGKVCVWLGRSKRTGRGPGTSGLAFDKIIPKV